MNVFEAVRESVTARRAAEACGIKANRSGMACCPFHRDRHPSMKLDKRFHCFGCQADGDAIDFAARFYGLSKKDAAIKLAHDFGIPYDDYRCGEKNRRSEKKESKRAPRVQKKTREQLLEQTEHGMYRIISDYYHLLRTWKEEYAPRSDEEEWHPLFVEALSNLTIVEYLMDTLLDAAAEEKIDLMNDYRERVKEYERRLKEYRAAEIGGAGQDNRNVQSR
ncbi:MAG: CHC2 zinc finger domain-containing protein [Lachnospiraceae bacterium]|nr:CHC2 zinc finger domain-containing protein [Lachnospiraceae bacterium]